MYADLAPFGEALFDQLAALLERPVFACCDSPQPDPAGTCQACGAELTDDQLRALVDCTHPTVADVPAGERSPCPDCGLVWGQALAAINVQHHELPDGHTYVLVPRQRFARRRHQLLLHDRTSTGLVRVLGDLNNINVTIVPFRLGGSAHTIPPVKTEQVGVQPGLTRGPGRIPCQVGRSEWTCHRSNAGFQRPPSTGS